MAVDKAARTSRSLTMILLVHDLPGRLRFRTSRVKGDRRAAAALRRRARALPGITRAILNPVTGSLILHYEGGPDTRDAIVAGVVEIAREPVAGGPERGAVREAAPGGGQPDLADLLANMLAEHLAEQLVRGLVSALI